MTAASASGERDRAHPRRIVALGGGTGLPAVLRGLKERTPGGDMAGLTAVVAMSDDGGSSGRLRRSRGLPPPGDVRNCLVALSAEEDLLAGLFQHRYDGDHCELGGHNLGNLILAALAEQTGSFLKAVEVSSRVLRTSGRILPVTLEDVTLEATLEDGSCLLGESTIGDCRRRILGLALRPAQARPTPGVVEAILEADLVVIGPGSLYTSVIPSLVLEPVARALRETRAVRILVGNLVSERGEAAGLSHADHLRVITGHAGGRIADALLVHDGAVEASVVERYREEGSSMLCSTASEIDGVRVFRHDLLARDRAKLRHDSAATAEGLIAVWRGLRAPAPAGNAP